jgi:glycosyltransferase involved in cell wall biosynthesis
LTLAGGRRIALVHDWLTGMRGGEKVLEAIAALAPEAPIFTLLHVPGSVSPALEAHRIHTSFIAGLPGVRRGYRRYLPLFPSAIEDFDLAGYDLVLSTSHCVAKGVVPAPGAVHVCYCHTPMRYAWDQEHAYFPKRRGLLARLRGLALTALRVWDVASAARVDRFLANSRFVAARIRRFYGRDAEVVPPPVDVELFAPAPSEQGAGAAGLELPEGEFALMVSALAPYKRIDVAIGACERLGLDLCVVGDGPERRTLETLAGPRTRFLRRLTTEQLRAAYQRARFFLQPGLEDFGIATVEALACGTPVVALGQGGVLDIVEDGVHGVLYSGLGCENLAAAVDNARKIRFNPLEIHRRAQQFSVTRFQDRLRASVAHTLAELEESCR